MANKTIYKRISFEERLQISNYIKDGLSNSEIARRLKRSRAAITQELQRNARVIVWRGKKTTLRHTYEPRQAEHRADTVRRDSHRHASKLTERKRQIIDQYLLEKKWSPEQIAHSKLHLKVSTTTIYNWVLNNKLKAKVADLPLKGKRRRKLRAKPVNKPQIRYQLEKRSISKRPKIIDKRSTFGHWEVDGVMSPQDSQSFVITLVERRTRFMVGVKTKSRQAEDVKTAVDTFMSRFENACDSITCDRGTEFTSIQFISQIELDYNKKLYYADPQSPGQRGTNERMNRELRRFFSAGYNFTKITQKRLQSVIKAINEKPRVALNYKSPEEEFLKRFKKIAA